MSYNSPAQNPTTSPHVFPHINPKAAVKIISKFGAIPPNESVWNNVDCNTKHTTTMIAIKILRFMSLFLY